MQHRKFKLKMVSVDKQRQSQPQQDSQCGQLRPHVQFAVGSDVEVSSDEEGFRGAWFLAKVISTPSKAQKHKYLVEYKSLVSEENGSDPLTELVDPSFVRPPLTAEEGGEVRFELNDIVEGRYCDGWWTGSVVEILGERRYRVFFKNPPHAIEFESSSLRFHKDWVDGKWIRPEKQIMGELALNPGTAVEINLGAQDSPYIWHLGTVVKEFGRRFFLVEYRRNETELLKAVVDSLHIRPSPPRSNENTFQLLDKVDAYCNFAWSNGIVTKVLASGRYIVFFKHSRKEKEMSHKDLRAPILHTDGNAVHLFQDAAMVSNAQEQSDSYLNMNGKISMPSKVSGCTKGRGEESRNDQEEKALHSEKSDHDAETKACLENNQATEYESSFERPFKKLSEVATPEAAPEPSKTKGAQPVNDPGSLEIPPSNVEGNSFMGQSASLARKSEAEDKRFGSMKRWSYRGRRPRGRGRPRGSVSRSPGNPVDGTASTIKRIKEATLGHPEKQANISLPCDTGPWDHLLHQNAAQLSVEKERGKFEKTNALNDTGTLEKTNALNDAGTLEKTNALDDAGTLEKTNALSGGVNDGVPVNDVDGGSPERRAEGSPVKKKRGRPPADLSGVRNGKTIETTGTFRRSTRERRTVYQAAIRRSTRERRTVYPSDKPKRKKPRIATDISSSTQGPKHNNKRKSEADSAIKATPNPEPVSHGASGDVSPDDDHRPISILFGEARTPSLPDATKENPARRNDVDAAQNSDTRQKGDVDDDERPISSLIGEPRSPALSDVTKENPAGGSDVDAAQNDDTRQEGLPFTKTSHIWKVIESMEVFKKIPQNPHFRPLYEVLEHCREGLAIGSMVTFSGLVEKISKFKCSDPKSFLEGTMETLLDLERQGFNIAPIRNRLKELLSVKSKLERAQVVSEVVQSQIAERQKKKAGIDEEVNELEKLIAELRQRQALAASQRKTTDSEMATLESKLVTTKKTFEERRAEFERLATAPW